MVNVGCRAMACLVSLALACGCDAEDATTVSLPITASGSGIVDVENDRQNLIHLTEARIAVNTLTFASGTTDDDVLAAAASTVARWLVPQAHAHPGHTEGGAVLGELTGHHLLVFTPGREQTVGEGTFLLGDVTGLNWVFGRAAEGDVDVDSALLGHTAMLQGEARRDGDVVRFTVIVDAPDDRELENVPCDFTVDDTSSAALNVQLLVQDPFEDDTLFDGVDFIALDDDDDGLVVIGPDPETEPLQDAYNQLRRTLLTHDHYAVTVAE